MPSRTSICWPGHHTATGSALSNPEANPGPSSAASAARASPLVSTYTETWRTTARLSGSTSIARIDRSAPRSVGSTKYRTVSDVPASKTNGSGRGIASVGSSRFQPVLGGGAGGVRLRGPWGYPPADHSSSMSISWAGSTWPLLKLPKPSSAFQGGMRRPRISSRIDWVHGYASR